ncbi:MAG: hypothetical protein K0Q51_342 [Rickettsiaceae bacterium]|jgi:hypothetical protein|nr:hypothetical protein [Rickettsiaceae bacterium]
MSKVHSIGSPVSWKWGQGIAHGVIEEVFFESVIRVIKGTKVTRNGTEDNPAYVIRQKDGTVVLKLHSELE